MMKRLVKFFNPVSWKNLRSTTPVSSVFGTDRGTPVDRYYIEKFLSANSANIRGAVLEIGSNEYTKRYGKRVDSSDVLHYTEGNPEATIIGDLTDAASLPESKFDCFICTQTLNFIFDFQVAIENIYRLLKEDGVALITVAGLCQVSRYDMDRWGDFWRFTTASAEKSFRPYFHSENLQVDSFGNVLSATALLQGISMEELTQTELDFKDSDYQIVITIIAKK